jgi:hypothetical protein
MTRGAALIVATALAVAACTSDVELGSWRSAQDTTHPFDTGQPPLPEPCIIAAPYIVDFGLVQRSIADTETVDLYNRCDAERRWLGLKLAGDPGFSVFVDGATYRPTTELATTGVSWAEPRAIAPGATVTIVVSYTPTAPGRDRANLILLTDDPGQPTGLAVRLEAGGDWPCLAILPKSVDFAGVMVGRTATEVLDLSSCGAVPLELTKLTLDGSPTLTLANPGAFTLPRTLSPGEHLRLDLAYAPAAVSPGTPEARVWDVATLALVANDFDRSHAVDVRGFGVDDACPTARIAVADALESAPVGATVSLSGADSSAIDGAVDRWIWSVAAPFSAVSPFEPDEHAAAVSYRLSIAGDYTFALDVVDTAGRHACALAYRTVRAVATADLRVELVWATPNDPDPYDEGVDLGADLDVHLAHPYAVGPDLDGDGAGDGFFDLPYDVFFDNPEPRWYPTRPTSEQPQLVEDDQDGTGPEVIEASVQPGGLEPLIGVHVWDDHGFGASAAVVRVFARGELVYESAPVTLLADELWEVGRITWPTPGFGDAVAPIIVPSEGTGGGPKVFVGVRATAGAVKP